MVKICDVDGLVSAFDSQDRRALSKVITYIESEQDAHQEIADKILLNIKKPHKEAIVVAISGPPGVGKSTFINALGKLIVDKNYHLAVLAIDPTSELSGGSILADKTRMTHLMKAPQVFIRPSPSRGTLGGISHASPDVIYALKSFGFDFIVLETVGVGQSETMARALADHFVMLMQPGAGDELQGMKKGVLEMADFILVNKADGDLEKLAWQSANILKAAWMQSAEKPYIDVISAQSLKGIDAFFERILKKQAQMRDEGSLELKRRKGLQKILRFSFEHAILRHVRKNLKLNQQIDALAKKIADEQSAIAPDLNDLVRNLVRKAVG